MRRDAFRWQRLLDAPVIACRWPTRRPTSTLRRARQAGHRPRAGTDAWPVPYWTVDASMSVMTLLLAAEDDGLGALFFGVFRGERELRRALGIPAGHADPRGRRPRLPGPPSTPATGDETGPGGPGRSAATDAAHARGDHPPRWLADRLSVEQYPGAQAPDRQYRIDADGIGARRPTSGAMPTRRRCCCVHGGFDFARTYDVFAPLLAAAGWRVVALGPARPRRQRPRRAVLLGRRPARRARRVRRASARRPVPGRRPLQGRRPDDPARPTPSRTASATSSTSTASRTAADRPTSPSTTRTKMLAERGRRLARPPPPHGRRPSASPGTLDELAERRGRMNPRLSPEWLRYLVTVGAREDADGWRWKIDPSMRFGGFGPWRPEWSMLAPARAGDAVPRRARPAARGDGLGHRRPRRCSRTCRPAGGCEILDDVGHFVHIEQPRRGRRHWSSTSSGRDRR